MGAISNTFQTYQSKGNREQLSDVIYDISPTETPFMTSAGRGSVKGVLFEWQVDALAAPSTTNRHIQGDDVDTFPAVTPTVRVQNYTQISRELLIISDTQEVIEKAGRKSELAYQLVKKGRELKRSQESMLLENIGASAGNASTASVSAGLGAWVKTNVDKASDGINPVYTTLPSDPRTDGTPRTFTEDMLKSVIQKGFNSGANFSTLMVGSTNKQVVSEFEGIAPSTFNLNSAKSTVIIGAADVYVSDFGKVTVVPNRFQRQKDAWLIDWEHVRVDYLRPHKTVPLAKTGDAEKRMLIAEYGLRVNNERGLGLVADLIA